MFGFGRKKEEESTVATSEEGEQSSEEAATTTGNCAWGGEPGNEFGSHGICAYHAEQMGVKSQWKKLQRVPSYAERFKDGREVWEDE
jgi:hypothetical protein